MKIKNKISKSVTDSLTVPVNSIIDGQNTSLKTGDSYIWNDEKASFNIKGLTGSSNPSWE